MVVDGGVGVLGLVVVLDGRGAHDLDGVLAVGQVLEGVVAVRVGVEGLEDLAVLVEELDAHALEAGLVTSIILSRLSSR